MAELIDIHKIKHDKLDNEIAVLQNLNACLEDKLLKLEKRVNDIEAGMNAALGKK
jgi:hypothetical protein